MPKGPRGENRPADAIGLAVMIGKIATGETRALQEAGESGVNDDIEFLPVIERGLEVGRRNLEADQKDPDQFTAFCVWQTLRQAGWSIIRTPS